MLFFFLFFLINIDFSSAGNTKCEAAHYPDCVDTYYQDCRYESEKCIKFELSCDFAVEKNECEEKMKGDSCVFENDRCVGIKDACRNIKEVTDCYENSGIMMGTNKEPIIWSCIWDDDPKVPLEESCIDTTAFCTKYGGRSPSMCKEITFCKWFKKTCVEDLDSEY